MCAFPSSCGASRYDIPLSETNCGDLEIVLEIVLEVVLEIALLCSYDGTHARTHTSTHREKHRSGLSQMEGA